MVAAQWLNMQLASDQELKPQAGMAFAGADLATPEGDFFFVSVSLRTGAEVEAVRRIISKQVGHLAAGTKEIPEAALIGRQLAATFTEVPDPQVLKAQAPAGMSLAMLEGNLGLQAGMREHRYGSHGPRLAQQLLEVSSHNVQQVARAYLSPGAAVICTLRPGTPSRDKE
jgi:hypothetical protein